ncbi:MAG TPA: arginyltransferase [Gemmataceae bacterium]|nr:arginyltransferase [Gemmataceae bacterium]
MESIFRYIAAPSQCGYLPDRQWSLEYEYVGAMTPAEYLQRLLEGWRRFGRMMFRPACPSCRACQSLRVVVDQFQPDRSQRRARQANAGAVELRIGKPSVTRKKLALYDRYHVFQSSHKGWPQHPARDSGSYAESFVRQPFPVEEWCYYVNGRLIGVGYVDLMPNAAEGGLSAIYFFYDPEERRRSLGTYNVLCVIEECRRRGLPYAYLGYYVEGNEGMTYKTRFAPNQLRGADGVWRAFRE